MSSYLKSVTKALDSDQRKLARVKPTQDRNYLSGKAQRLFANERPIVTSNKVILDPCCGSRMFWFDKKDDRAVFTDKRAEQHTLCDGRELIIEPDMVMDFTDLQFDDEQFHMIVFDPPHLRKAGKNSWMALKYGKLDENWPNMIRDGFTECFRVLKPNGTLIFKWNEDQIPVKDILALTDQKPVVGHRSGKRSNTHWICFLKSEVTNG